MESSKSQAGKSSSDKRKREKSDQDESSHKKRRKHGKAAKQDPADTPSKRRHIDTNKANPTSNKDHLHPRAHKDVPREAGTLQKWWISEPRGGRMADADPIFTADEK